jgi:hypothetical protein
MTRRTVKADYVLLPRVMSKREAAAYMRITVSGVESLMRQGRLSVVQYPDIKRYLVDRWQIDKLIRECETYLGPLPPQGSQHGLFEAAYGIKTHSIETMAAAKKKQPSMIAIKPRGYQNTSRWMTSKRFGRWPLFGIPVRCQLTRRASCKCSKEDAVEITQ